MRLVAAALLCTTVDLWISADCVNIAAVAVTFYSFSQFFFQLVMDCNFDL